MTCLTDYRTPAISIRWSEAGQTTSCWLFFVLWDVVSCRGTPYSFSCECWIWDEGQRRCYRIRPLRHEMSAARRRDIQTNEWMVVVYTSPRRRLVAFRCGNRLLSGAGRLSQPTAARHDDERKSKSAHAPAALLRHMATSKANYSHRQGSRDLLNLPGTPSGHSLAF